MRASAELSEGSYDHKGSCEQGSLATEEDVVDEARVLGEESGRKGEWVPSRNQARKCIPSALAGARSRPAHKLDLVQPG